MHFAKKLTLSLKFADLIARDPLYKSDSANAALTPTSTFQSHVSADITGRTMVMSGELRSLNHSAPPCVRLASCSDSSIVARKSERNTGGNTSGTAMSRSGCACNVSSKVSNCRAASSRTASGCSAPLMSSSSIFTSGRLCLSANTLRAISTLSGRVAMRRPMVVEAIAAHQGTPPDSCTAVSRRPICEMGTSQSEAKCTDGSAAASMTESTGTSSTPAAAPPTSASFELREGRSAAAAKPLMACRIV
mmetsp:Transcript_3722/g.9644  ORF Transcript_3722/g.9644 Transcript_3722/m.9644 type:complete len:248 (-) Transcript_3722:529-1272(-)